MRRLLALIAVIAAGALAGGLAAGGPAQGSSTATFDVIFDDARGLVPGQLVKIAGAQAGTIENVTLTRDFKARIEATVSSTFLPLHRDAACTIRPQGLIGENYVECDPGTLTSPALRTTGGAPPTIGVARTTEPVSLLDLFGIFNAPTRERLTVLLNELGIATAARGQDINAILRRANPALAAAQRVIGILDHQHGQLATIVDATSTLARSGAAHTAALRAFLERSAGLTAQTAAHRGALAQTVARLPGLLATAQPALAQLDAVAVGGTPLVRQLHVAVPALNRASADLGPFAAAARPALAKLRIAVGKVIPALVHAAPLLSTLRSYADRSRRGTRLSARLFANLQRHGFFENFFNVFYYIGASLARHDATSHLLSILLLSPDNGQCGNYATAPVPGCSAHYGAQPAYQPEAAAARHGRPDPAGQAAAAAARTPGSPTGNAGALQGLVNYLTK